MNKIPMTYGHSAAWAANNIESPFIFLPLSIATGTALGTTGITVISNISGCPSTFACVDADSSADNTEGFWTNDHATDADYFWPGAGYDYNASVEHGLFALGKQLFRSGISAGVGGGVLLFAATINIPSGATNAGGLLTFGNRDTVLSGDGFGFGVAPSTGALNFSQQIGTTITQADTMNASLVVNTTQRVAVLLDFANGEVLSAKNGVAQTVAGKAGMLSAANAKTLTGCGWTFGGLNASVTPDSRVISTSGQCLYRDLLLMDLSSYANAQADFYELADRLARTPAFSLPHWMDRF